MTVLEHIGFRTEKKLITLITISGRRAKLMKLLEKRKGILSLTVHHARGTDHSTRQSGKLQWSERDVLVVLVEAPQADEFSRCCSMPRS